MSAPAAAAREGIDRIAPVPRRPHVPQPGHARRRDGHDRRPLDERAASPPVAREDPGGVRARGGGEDQREVLGAEGPASGQPGQQKPSPPSVADDCPPPRGERQRGQQGEGDVAQGGGHLDVDAGGEHHDRPGDPRPGTAHQRRGQHDGGQRQEHAQPPVEQSRRDGSVEGEPPEVPHLHQGGKRRVDVVLVEAEAVVAQEDLGQLEVVAERVAGGRRGHCRHQRPQARQRSQRGQRASHPTRRRRPGRRLRLVAGLGRSHLDPPPLVLATVAGEHLPDRPEASGQGDRPDRRRV